MVWEPSHNRNGASLGGLFTIFSALNSKKHVHVLNCKTPSGTPDLLCLLYFFLLLEMQRQESVCFFFSCPIFSRVFSFSHSSSFSHFHFVFQILWTYSKLMNFSKSANFFQTQWALFKIDKKNSNSRTCFQNWWTVF